MPRIARDSPRYARYWLAQIVSAPYGGTSIACRIEPIGGSGRNEKSECHKPPNTSPALLARFPHDRDHLGMAGDRLDERHRAVRPEPAAERDLLFRRERLLAEEDHLVIEQRPPDLGDHVVVEFAARGRRRTDDRAARAGERGRR